MVHGGSQRPLFSVDPHACIRSFGQLCRMPARGRLGEYKVLRYLAPDVIKRR